MKDLPKVFANPIEDKKDNNRSFVYSKLEREKKDIPVREKIDKLFSNDRTIYSIDCIIKLDSGEKKCTVIGKTMNNLVTKNQEIIPISSIKDIDLA